MATQPTGLAPGSLDRFWAWWATARDRLGAAIDAQTFSKQLAREMTNAVGAMHPSIAWEVGPGAGSRYALTLSFDGDPSVRRLTAAWLWAAPPPDEAWEYHAARQPAPDRDVHLAGHRFSPTDFRIACEYDETRERFDVALYHPLFDRVSDDVCHEVALLALDHLLGEDGVERWLGAVDVAATPPPEGAPLSELAAEVERRRPEATGRRLILGQALDPNGSPVVLTVNTALKQIDHLDHLFHLAVFIRLNQPMPDGLPSAEEAARLNAAEEDLLGMLGDDAVQLGRLTLAARREIHLYLRDPEAAEQVISAWRGRADVWGMNYSLEPDPGWGFAEEGFYRALAPRQTAS
jgi:hypothetical protein